MSLLINGMGMPRCCKECGLLIDEDFSCDSSPHYCAVNQYLRWRDWSEVPEYISAGCLLIEIPIPHGDLIDRDDLLEYFERKSKGKTAEEALKLLYTALKAYPTVIEKEMN